MDIIKVSCGVAAAVMITVSGWTLFNLPVAQAQEERPLTTIVTLGKERTTKEISDINALARMLYGEARGIQSDTEKAACIWVVLNRVDDDRWSDDILEVLSQPWQFGGYSVKHPVEEELRELAADVYDRWVDEKSTGQDSGRIIPNDYFFWYGDGKHNYFRKEYKDKITWDWSIDSPYNS